MWGRKTLDGWRLSNSEETNKLPYLVATWYHGWVVKKKNFHILWDMQRWHTKFSLSQSPITRKAENTFINLLSIQTYFIGGKESVWQREKRKMRNFFDVRNFFYVFLYSKLDRIPCLLESYIQCTDDLHNHMCYN